MDNNTATRAGSVVHNQNNFEIERSNVEFPSCGTVLKGIFLTPMGKRETLPTIVMAPGMSGVKEGSIMKYAEYFARGGFAVLAYDNINFGESGGEPRQEVDPALQRRGYRDAITNAFCPAPRVQIIEPIYSNTSNEIFAVVTDIERTMDNDRLIRGSSDSKKKPQAASFARARRLSSARSSVRNIRLV